MKKLVSRKMRLIPNPRATCARIRRDQFPSNAPSPTLPFPKALQASLALSARFALLAYLAQSLRLQHAYALPFCQPRSVVSPNPKAEGTFPESLPDLETLCPFSLDILHPQAAADDACVFRWQKACVALPDSLVDWQHNAARRER